MGERRKFTGIKKKQILLVNADIDRNWKKLDKDPGKPKEYAASCVCSACKGRFRGTNIAAISNGRIESKREVGLRIITFVHGMHQLNTQCMGIPIKIKTWEIL